MSHSLPHSLLRPRFRSSAPPLPCPTPRQFGFASLCHHAVTSRSRLITSSASTSRSTSSSASGSTRVAKPSSSSSVQPSPSTSGRRFPRLSILVDYLRVQLSIPLSDVVILTVSAALRFRHIPNWPWSPSIFELDHKRISSSVMLIEEQEKLDALRVVSESVPAEGTSQVAATGSGGTPSSSPPSYSQAVGSSVAAIPSSNEKWPRDQDRDYSTGPIDSSSTSSTLNIPTPSNFVHIFRRDGAIRGQWNIHPTLRIPTTFLSNSPTVGDTNYAKSRLPGMRVPLSPGIPKALSPGIPKALSPGIPKALSPGLLWKSLVENQTPIGETGPQPNLILHTRDGRITADVWISDSTEQDEGQETKPTILDLNTRDGKITLRLRTCGARPLDIRLLTHDGPISVFLPRSFTGLITHEIRDGKLVFSPSMLPSATTFTQIEGKTGSSFIGDWRALMQGGEAAIGHWEGNRCHVASRDGSIYFFWEDEWDEVMAQRNSNWFKKMYWAL